MIRREVSSGAAAEWILISQIDHARLAGRLACGWGADGFAPLVPHAEVLWAIDHHDDGWREWDEAPDVDPANGRPRSFTEMVIDDSLKIWTHSIEAAAATGPLQAYAVAGHFCALARRAAAWKSGDAGWLAVQDFLANTDRVMDAARQCVSPVPDIPDVAGRALAQLQFFDALSLWFCCAEATESELSEPPGGPELALTPEGPECIRLAPWPYLAESLNLEIAARAVAARHYQDRDDLAAAPSQPVTLHWRLLAG